MYFNCQFKYQRKCQIDDILLLVQFLIPNLKKTLLYEYCNYMECEQLLEHMKYLKSEVDWLKFAIQM